MISLNRALGAFLAAVLGAAATVFALSSPAQALGNCEPATVALPLPAGFVRGEALEGAGSLVVGDVRANDGVQHAAIWQRVHSRWTVLDLGAFGAAPPFGAAFAGDVNRHGQVVVTVLGDVPSGYLWHKGALHQLKDFSGGTQASPRRINQRGQIVGEAYDDQGGDYAAVWDHWWSTPRKLSPVEGDDGSFGSGVNDLGVTVGGSFSFGPPPDVPTRWSRAGTASALTDLGHGGDASDINDLGRTVGWVFEADGTNDAAAWSDGQLITTPPLEGTNLARFFGVSHLGRVTGVSALRLPRQPVTFAHLLYWPGHGPVQTLLPLSGNWSDTAGAHGVSDEHGGTVYGSSKDTDGVERATLWTCADRQAIAVPTLGGAS